MDKDWYEILVFGQKASQIRRVRIRKSTVKVGFYLLAFILLSATFFLCDYIQTRKKAFELNRLRQEAQTQRFQIHFFSARISELENQLARLKEFDKKIRIIANLDREQDGSTFGGIGGPSPADVRNNLKSDIDTGGLIQQMRIDVQRLKSEALAREESLSELEKLLTAKKEILAHTPSIWPANGWVTSGFGFRTNPFTGLNQMHEGIDISNRVGTPVFATADGVISYAGTDYALGRVLVISHGFGMTTRYCHLNRVFVKIGQKVKRGEKIAEIGATGMTTGPHLHYEVRLSGMPVNPMRYILN